MNGWNDWNKSLRWETAVAIRPGTPDALPALSDPRQCSALSVVFRARTTITVISPVTNTSFLIHNHEPRTRSSNALTVSAGIDAFFSYEIPQTEFTRRIMFDGLKKRARLKLSTLGKSDTGNPFNFDPEEANCYFDVSRILETSKCHKPWSNGTGGAVRVATILDLTLLV